LARAVANLRVYYRTLFRCHNIFGCTCPAVCLQPELAVSSRARDQKTPLWPESVSELYRPSESRLSAKLVPTFADRGFHVVNVTDPYDRNLGFLDRSNYSFFQAAPQL
jgi:hypothetical protein